LAVGELPDWARDRLVVRSSVEIGIHKRLNDRGAGLGVVASVDGGINACIDVVGDGDGGRQIELRVQSASAVALLDGLWGRELVHVSRASAGTVQALLDAVAFVLDLGEGQVDLSHDTGHIEATSVSDAAIIHGAQARANRHEATFVVVIVAVVVAIAVIASTHRTSEGTNGKERNKESSGEMHLVV